MDSNRLKAMIGVLFGQVRHSNLIFMITWMNIKKLIIFQIVLSWQERTDFVIMSLKCKKNLGKRISILFLTHIFFQMNSQISILIFIFKGSKLILILQNQNWINGLSNQQTQVKEKEYLLLMIFLKSLLMNHILWVDI